MADGETSELAGRSTYVLGKFQHPDLTADGAARASVALTKLETLWINTGTLCNVECAHCYIESSPTNDRLTYLTSNELAPFLIEAKKLGTQEIGFTGGEPFMNPDMPAMIEASLEHGFSVLILTNAMRPMMRPKIQEQLLSLHQRFGAALSLRVSLDHFDPTLHDAERGPDAFAAGLKGLTWLTNNGFVVSVAGRTLWSKDEVEMRDGFTALFKDAGIALDAQSQQDLILFPEMDENTPVPEITDACWSILDKSPDDMMCASARMVVKRKGADAPTVLSCTLLPYDEQFEMGATLEQASAPVKLNHPHCAKFCVLGGASCSG